MDLAPGTTIGRFVLARALGRRVYVAHDPELRRDVIVKVLDPGEADGIARLAHPGVAVVHDVGTHAGHDYLAREWVPGDTLVAWLASRPSNVNVVARSVALARALIVAHEAGLVVRSFDDVRLAGETPKITALVAGDAAAQLANLRALEAALGATAVGKRLPRPAPSLAALVASLEGLHEPPPRRSGRVVVAMIVAIAIGGTAAIALRRQSLCRGFAPRLQLIYAESARQRIRDGLRRASAATPVEAIVAHLDAYAARWIASGEGACRETRIVRSQPEPVLDLRVACLDRRRAELAQLVEILAAADRTIAQNSAGLVRSLGDLDDCADVTRLAGVLPEPTDATQRKAIRDAREQLAALRAIYNAGTYREGLARIGPLLVTVKQLDYAPLTAETHFVAAMLQRGVGAHEQAIAELKEAALVAEVGRDDALRADAWTEVVQSLIQSGKYDEAATHVPQADAAIQRLGAPPMATARLLRCRGQLEVAKENFGVALPLWRSALALIADRADRDPAFTALLNDDLSALLPATGAPFEESLRYGEAGLAAWRALYGDKHPFVASSLDGLGGAYSLVGRHREALRATQDALAMREELLGKTHTQVGESVLHMAQLESSAGHYRRALALYDRAEPIFAVSQTGLLDRRAIRRGRAEIYTAQERDGEAAALLRKLLNATGEDALSDLERPWIVLAQAAIAERQLGPAAADKLYAQADVQFVKHLADDPIDLEGFRVARARQLVEHGRAGAAKALVHPAWMRAETLTDRNAGRRFEPALLFGEALLGERDWDSAAIAIAEARRIDDLGDQLNEHDRAQLRLAEVELGLAQKRDHADLVKLLDEADKLLQTDDAPLTKLHARATRLRKPLHVGERGTRPGKSSGADGQD